MAIVMLLDNGSVRAESTLRLRWLAQRLEENSGQTIYPVSLNHSDKVPASELENTSAQVFDSFVRQHLDIGESEFLLIPLFFAKNRALSKLIPEKTEALKNEYPDIQIRLADPLYPLPDGEELLVDIVYDHVMGSLSGIAENQIVLVDHGSPSPEVTKVRNQLTKQVQARLPDDLHLDQAVMERRPGRTYDFNGELLKDWLDRKGAAGIKQVSVILLFFLPGRHAGKNGDIVEICENSAESFPNLHISISPLISEHPGLLSILSKRLEELSEN